MTIGDQSESDSILPCRNRMSVDVGAPSPRSIQMDEQVNPGEEYAPKIRKPYTISKQRERWSEEEHKKFLEALKLHGRAWRRIEGKQLIQSMDMDCLSCHSILKRPCLILRACGN